MPASIHIRVDDITHSYGEHRVLTDLSLVAGAGDRLGLIGENGAGKSTLLRIVAGVEQPDAGSVSRPARTGLLWQEVRHDPATTVGAMVENALAEVRGIERELEAAASALSESGGDERYAVALAAAERVDLWTTDARVAGALAGLGVDDIPLFRPLGEVSGGQRSRLALAALLLERPDALLLDEPTNHLDDASVEYLRDQLVHWRGPVVFASHDRAFLDEVATVLLDIDPSRSGTTRFGGGYTTYLGAKAAERARWEQQFAAEENEIADLEASLATTAREVSHARPMRDRNKMSYGNLGDKVQSQVSRRVRNARARLEDLEQSRVDAPAPVLSFAGIPSGAHALGDESALITLSDARLGDRLDVPAFAIAPASRMLVTGPNGAGKSTMLGVLAGRIATDSGSVRRRKGLRVALLEQDVRFAEPNRTAAASYEETVGERRAADVPLGSLGLIAPRDLHRPVGQLSVGQQRRLALALIIAKPPHVFLLDEPTNHLSLSLATELEDALGSYPGAVVVASHDRWLRRRWDGASVVMRDGKIVA